ncbi:hypothetical protein KOR34_41420 [Posidoniimonas corsicana]|uniref:Alpha/beta hydrolase family protein n=1 Tax=Posidoniimonas corsicana TaxID=1938618 RepID=A0A5C5V365_9BACT|nr:hypothetical protein [Posidoniimonas corsicana]TWT32379.1 hypothetical protein KOR34_41420 [Posidoniimonas corsicana]
MIASPPACLGDVLPRYHTDPWFDEQVREETIDQDVRVRVIAPPVEQFDADRPTRLILYALPNGNTIEQTLGCQLREGLDWHFDIQHIAAQTRRLREVSPDENILLACLEAKGLSWPAWRRGAPERAEQIAAVYRAVKMLAPVDATDVTLAAHSGGGSFVWGVLDAHEQIPAEISRIALLDANYSYNEQSGHGAKFLEWLQENPNRRLIVLAYDDRNITYQGKRVVGPTGGTYRATGRMRDRFAQDFSIDESVEGDFQVIRALDGRITMQVHRNPENKILHTALVGDMNGLLYAATLGAPQAGAWGEFAGPRAYTDWIQPPPDATPSRPAAPPLPPRAADAIAGARFVEQVADLPPHQRESAIVQQLAAGNLPDRLRAFTPIKVTAADATGNEHSLTYMVTPDYLAVGADGDYVRMPMTPMSAQAIADRFGCTLPTARMVDQIDQNAVVKLAPRPLTERREALRTFAQHNAIIESQRAGAAGLICGVKKDLVLTNRLAERPGRVAIYGWRRLSGEPIQPVTTVHTRTYVDYSHGVRLVGREMLLDGQPTTFTAIVTDNNLAPLLSSAGPLHVLTYPTE